MPLGSPLGQALTCFVGTLRLINPRSLFQQLLPHLAFLFPFEFAAIFGRNIVQFVKNAVLLRYARPIHQGQDFPQPSAPITHYELQIAAFPSLKQVQLLALRCFLIQPKYLGPLVAFFRQ